MIKLKAPSPNKAMAGSRNKAACPVQGAPAASWLLYILPKDNRREENSPTGCQHKGVRHGITYPKPAMSGPQTK